MKFVDLAACLACLGVGPLAAAPTSRAADYPEALVRARETGNDIVVFQRGSDWNRLGETLYQNVWLRPEFVAALGEGFVLVAVDRPEQPGAPALGTAGDPSSIARFQAAVAPEAPPPENTITHIQSESDATYQRRGDGASLVNGPENEHNPATDLLTFTVAAPAGGNLLRLDFPPDATLPNGCAGRAPNGNFFLSEVELTSSGKPLGIAAAWASAAEGAWTAAQVIDGIKDQPANGWNPAANQRQARTLMLVLGTPVRAATTISVTLVCKAQWPQHIPGCFRAAILADPQLAAAVVKVTEAQALAAKNTAFDWWDGGICPRVALLDPEGRAIDADNQPRAGLTPATLAGRIKKLREKRQARDEFLAKAASAAGPAKAELLRQALEVLEIRNWPGNGNCYQPIHARIKEADPGDLSGATRWLGFGSDPRGGVPWAKPAWNEVLDTQGGKRVPTDADYLEALARVDKELADPRNNILSKENIQRMMVAKYHIYRSWKGHEEERFRIQQEIAGFDPTTFWGIGGAGYCGMYGKSPTPYLTYGWKPNQVHPGSNEWKMTDTAGFFDHPGKYKVSLAHTGGTDKLRVKRLALMDGAQVLAEVAPDRDLGPGAEAKLEVFLDCPGWQPGTSYTFLAQLEAADGHADSSGSFAIEPWLEEPTGASDADYAKVRQDLRRTLHAACLRRPAALDQALATDSLRRDLAVHELVRRCGETTLTNVAAANGGVAFLKAFTSDPGWLESFLANDEAKWPQALENLRLLHANATAETTDPLYRRLATALALAAGEMNRYRLLDRFLAIIGTHRGGLLHASFDNLTTREMRWAVLLPGTAADYQFMVDATQVRLADYLGSCWRIAYVDPNTYGYSVQGWGYADPWTHHYGTGTGDRPFRAQQLVGGVCGTLSGFGASTAKAHGVMSTTVGQPGHCAYVVRIGGEWPTGYDVSGPETNGASVFEGTGFPTMHRLYEVIHADRAAYLKASRLAWAAHLLLDVRNGATTWSPAWADAYTQAIAAQPVNYAVWLDRIKAMEACSDVPASAWLKAIETVAKNFGPYHEAGWALINRCYAKASPGMTPAARMELLLKCHQCLTQANAPGFMGYNSAAVLNTQADSLGDPALAVPFLGRLLKIHFNPDPTRNRVFGDVMNWGNARFAANPATSASYARIIGTFFTSQRGKADPNQMRAQLTAGIRKASETADLPAYQLWTAMAAKLLPPVQAGELHLNAQQLAEPPKLAPFAGALLSKGAILQTSSACQYDRPLSYPAILDGTGPGYFDTNNEQKPWAQVALAGDSEVSGIVLLNRFELPATNEEFRWAAPLKVYASPDGKAWTEVATCDQADLVMRIELAGKVPRARFIRIERQVVDAAKPPRLHFRNFLVYGRKLY